VKPAKLVLASGNKGKLLEITAMLRPLGFDVHPQSDWNVPEAAETASTFIENALDKARNAARHTGLAALADDSGLVVPVLNGEPGIYSARYAGEGADDKANLIKLIEMLQQQSGRDRQAYFYCAMVLVKTDDDPAPVIATSRWYGQILLSPTGDGGFGYDPIFAVGNRNCSAAELDTGQKQQISHRGKALRELVRQINEQAGTC
jgi:XTP/dITP diphosphohydrolase